jgi:hypothetical protein
VTAVDFPDGHEFVGNKWNPVRISDDDNIPGKFPGSEIKMIHPSLYDRQISGGKRPCFHYVSPIILEFTDECPTSFNYNANGRCGSRIGLIIESYHNMQTETRDIMKHSPSDFLQRGVAP